MMIGLNEAMQDPTEQEIGMHTRDAAILEIKQQRIREIVVDGIKQHLPEEYTAIAISGDIMVDMCGLFIEGKYLGLHVVVDPALTGYSVKLLTAEEHRDRYMGRHEDQM